MRSSATACCEWPAPPLWSWIPCPAKSARTLPSGSRPNAASSPNLWVLLQPQLFAGSIQSEFLEQAHGLAALRREQSDGDLIAWFHALLRQDLHEGCKAELGFSQPDRESVDPSRGIYVRGFLRAWNRKDKLFALRRQYVGEQCQPQPSCPALR